MGISRMLRIYLMLGFATAIAMAIIYRQQFDAGAVETWLKSALLLVPVVLVLAFLPRLLISIRRSPTINIPELKRRIDSNATLVLDVRTAEDYVGEQGHIEGAVNIAVEELPARITELGDYLEQPIALVCRTDKRSAKAALLLTRQGFGDVTVVTGGMTLWHKAGLPVIAVNSTGLQGQ